MADIRVVGEYVLINDSVTSDVIMLKKVIGRVETSQVVDHSYDYSQFDSSNMPPLPATGQPCIAEELYTDGTYNWRCIQSHTRTTDPPANIPALFARYLEQGAPFVQPTGAHDDYNLGNIVEWEGEYYQSILNSNVWSPTAYPAGWQLIIFN